MVVVVVVVVVVESSLEEEVEEEDEDVVLSLVSVVNGESSGKQVLEGEEPSVS